MKKVVTIFLVIVFLLQMSSMLMIFVSYQINKKYIAEHLCINRNHPQMHCNGKCHLAKELRNQEKREQTPANSLKTIREMLLFSQDNRFVIMFFPEDKLIHHSAYLLIPYGTLQKSVEHPPCNKA